jgi:hypothetical protein
VTHPVDYVKHESLLVVDDKGRRTVRCWTLYDENDGFVGRAFAPGVLADDWAFTDKHGGWAKTIRPISMTRLCALMVEARLLGEPDE